MINQEIINVLEEKKFISNFQLDKIKDKLKDLCDSDFRDFFKHYQDYYNHKKKLNFKQFVNELIDYLVKVVETESFKVVSGYCINEIEIENRVNSFYDNLENEDNEDLKNYSWDSEKFTHIEYYDSDYINEDVKNCLNFNDRDNIDYENSYDDSYIKIEGFDLLEDFKHYDSFKEFFEDLDNLVYEIDLNKQVYMRFILDNDLFNCYTNYDNTKSLAILDSKIKKEISEILGKRLKENKKELRKEKAKLKELEKQLKAVRKPLIKDSVKVNIEKVNNNIKFLNNEVEIIKS